MRVARDVDRLRERARVAVRRRDDDDVPARLDRQRPPRERLGEVFAVPALLGERVDEAAALVPHLLEPELVDVTRDRRLDDVVTRVPPRVCELALPRDRPLATEP